MTQLGEKEPTKDLKEWSKNKKLFDMQAKNFLSLPLDRFCL